MNEPARRPPARPASRWKVLAARWLKRALALCVLLVIGKIVWVEICRTRASELADGRALPALRARERYLVGRVLSPTFTTDPSALPDDGPFAGEWRLVPLSMTAASVANLALADRATLPSARKTMRRIIERMLRPEIRVFDKAQWGGEDALESLDGPHGHVGFLGHLALALGANAAIRGDARWEGLRARIVDALARRMSSGCPYIETYPGETYTEDNAVAFAAISVHDLVARADHRALLERVLAYTREHLLERVTGLVVFGVDASCGPTGGARGSGVGWNSFYWPFVDETFAIEQYTRAKRFLIAEYPLGFAGVLEHPGGQGESWGDVDSGPLVLGVSPAATGFFIAGARQAGDGEMADRLLYTAELFGSTFQWNGERRYLLAPLVGDAILLAMVTARPWTDALP